MHLETLIKEYYASCKVMQLATVNEGGQPWICTVQFASDGELKLYWNSTKARQHSKEILNDSRVAVTIVKDVERKQALQMIGKASMVGRDDVDRVNKLYGDKFGDKPERLAEIRANTPDGRAYWVFTPEVIYLWDEVNFPTSPKQQYVVKVRK